MDREVMHLRDSLVPQYASMVYNGFWFAPERIALQAMIDQTQKTVNGYRNRAKMTISTTRDRRSSLGYFQRKSRTVVDAPDCSVLVPELLQTTRQLRRLLNTSDRFPFNLRHIDLRCGTDPTRQHLTLVVKSEDLFFNFQKSDATGQNLINLAFAL